MRVLGIDPGLRNTGFGIIEVINNKPNYVVSGVISTISEKSLPNRLKIILEALNEVITDTKPQIVSIEKVFVNVNPQSTLLLGQARGTALSACVLNSLEVSEYTALQIKKSVVGYGHADKSQVTKMVKYLLNLDGYPQADAADALAAALAHIHYANLCNMFNMNISKGGRLTK